MKSFSKKQKQSKPKMWETWVDGDGKEYKVNEMSEDHVRNALNSTLRKDRLKVEREFNRMIRSELNGMQQDIY